MSQADYELLADAPDATPTSVNAARLEGSTNAALLDDEEAAARPLTTDVGRRRSLTTDDDALMPAPESLLALYAICAVSSFDNSVMLPTLWPFVRELCESEGCPAHAVYGGAQAARVAGV